MDKNQMKLSEFIGYLQWIQSQYGDLKISKWYAGEGEIQNKFPVDEDEGDDICYINNNELVFC